MEDGPDGGAVDGELEEGLGVLLVGVEHGDDLRGEGVVGVLGDIDGLLPDHGVGGGGAVHRHEIAAAAVAVDVPAGSPDDLPVGVDGVLAVTRDVVVHVVVAGIEAGVAGLEAAVGHQVGTVEVVASDGVGGGDGGGGSRIVRGVAGEPCGRRPLVHLRPLRPQLHGGTFRDGHVPADSHNRRTLGRQLSTHEQ